MSPKRQKLLQTLHQLTDAMRQEKGFINARIHMGAEDLNMVTLTETWGTQEEVDMYMQQFRYFQVLREALKVLTASAKMKCPMRLK